MYTIEEHISAFTYPLVQFAAVRSTCMCVRLNEELQNLVAIGLILAAVCCHVPTLQARIL